ncbi:MAG: single-stranded-DNA-specific exonuclease RecJ [Eubacteriales bacterium]
MPYLYEERDLDHSVKTDSFVSSLSPVVQGFLARRGYNTPQDIYQVFHGDMSIILNNLDMKDSDKAVALLQNAIKEKEKIVVYRDYDCDGCCAAAVTVAALASLGAQVFQYGNQRELDGYGICIRGIEQILCYHPDTKVILTVDNGIVAYEAVEFAKSKGLTVIVTDHHEMGEELPVADAVVDPKRRDEFCNFRELCGAGVAFKLMLALYTAENQDLSPVLFCTDIVAMATVGDIVPLYGENRIIVKEGLKMMNQGTRPFFREVMRQEKLNKISASSELGFRIVPMINAPSRMGGDVNVAVCALLEGENNALTEQVAYLKQLNEARKKETEVAQRKAAQIVKTMDLDAPALLVLCPDLPEGLVGLVAGRLMNTYHKIVGVFHQGKEGMLKGSFRGIEGFHIKDALDQISSGLLQQYGGHGKAAGLSLPEENFEAFQAEFMALVQVAFPEGTGEASVFLDGQLEEEDCNLKLALELQELEPFGEGFPPPYFSLSLPENNPTFMGTEKQHVAYVGKGGLRALRWRYGEKERESTEKAEIFYGNLDINHFRGRETVQFLCQ